MDQSEAVNFLAHLWLADRSDTSLAGSVLGDVVRGADLSAYPHEIAIGVRLHRRVDAATDRHAVMRREREAFVEGERRYAGIVLDLAADHALAQAWSDFHPQPLPDFARHCAEALADAGDWFELAGGWRPTRAGFAELLESYATDRGMERALQRTSTRLRDPQGLIDSGRRWMEASQSLRGSLPVLLADLLALMRTA
nr:ACP phosphodiesterase [Panacagrimonas sp.]